MPAVIFLFLISLFWSVYSNAQNNQPETVQENKPEINIGIAGRPLFQYVDENGQFAGLDVELSKLIFTEAGFDIRFHYYPWTRILHLIEQGELDVGLSAADSDERKQYAYFSSETFRSGQNILFTNLENKSRFSNVTKLQQLKGVEFRLAVLRGAAYSEEYEGLKTEDWFSEKLLVVDSPKRTLDLLVRGRVQAFLGSEYGVKFWARDIDYLDQLVPVFPLMTSKEAETHIMFSKKSVPMIWVRQVDKAMKKLKNSGEYQRFISRTLSNDVSASAYSQ